MAVFAYRLQDECALGGFAVQSREPELTLRVNTLREEAADLIFTDFGGIRLCP